jgi:hypothetical protein
MAVGRLVALSYLSVIVAVNLSPQALPPTVPTIVEGSLRFSHNA